MTDVTAPAPTLQTAPATRLSLPPLQLGRLTVDVPVVLAPMAGVTNRAFRRLCREYGGGLYVTEMVTARALVERRPESLRIIEHDDDEEIRSIQIYGVDAVNVGKAVRMVAEEDRADHIDLNFGCPVPKVTKNGGGSALPWKRDLFEAIVTTAVREASRAQIPVTVKMRKGIDEDHLTFLDAAKTARDAGVAAIALHGRTGEHAVVAQADVARLLFAHVGAQQPRLVGRQLEAQLGEEQHLAGFQLGHQAGDGPGPVAAVDADDAVVHAHSRQ